MPENTVTIDALLRMVPESPERVLSQLESQPDLASASDSNGYSLLHASASYSQLVLLRALVRKHNVDVNIRDHDGETALFAAETLEAAKCLVEELGADPSVMNEDGATAEDNAVESMEDGAEWAKVADFLELLRTGGNEQSGDAPSLTNGDIGAGNIEPGHAAAGEDGENVHAPPPLPPNVRITTGVMTEQPPDGDNAPDPEFRRRIEELAARDDFQGADGQRELRDLIAEAVGGLAASQNARDVRSRMD